MKILATSLLCVLCLTAFAQRGTVDQTFNPVTSSTGVIVNPNQGYLYTALQADGKMIVVGYLGSLNGVATNGAVRLNADWTIDPTFAASASGLPSAVALQADGKILVGGNFQQFNGVSVSSLVRLNSNGSIDNTFSPGAFTDPLSSGSGNIESIVIQPDGKIVVGGRFATVGGVAKANIARLNSNGTLDSSFNPPATAGTTSDDVNDIKICPDGKFVITGWFTSYGGTARPGFARINADGTMDNTFVPGTIGGAVSQAAVQADGKIVIVGSFTSYGGVARNYFARLNLDGSLDTPFIPAPTYGSKSRVHIQPDGKIITLGSYLTRYNTNGTVDTSFISEFPVPGQANYFYSIITSALHWNGDIVVAGYSYPNTSGTPLTTFFYRLSSTGAFVYRGTNGGVQAIRSQSDGKLIVGGMFSTYNGVRKSGLLRLTADGIIDNTFSANMSVSANAIVIQPDGKILASDGTSITRVNSDGSTDNTFASNNCWPAIYSIALQSDGKVIAGGVFTTFNSAASSGLVRLNSNGTVDNTFAIGTGPNTAWVTDIVIQTDGKILITGDFTSFNGVARNRIVRLNTDGSVDASFNPGSGLNVIGRRLKLLPDGKILVGGDFYFYNGVSTYGLVRIMPDGTLDNTFHAASAPGFYAAMEVLSDGKILLGPSTNLVKLNADGSLDATFNSAQGYFPAGWISSLVVQPNGKIIVGGQFSSHSTYGSNNPLSVTTVANIARLFDCDTPALTFSPTAPIGCIGSPVSITVSGASTYSWSPASNLSATTGATVTASPPANTTYTVTGTNVGGCAANANVNVSVPPTPTITTSGIVVSPCLGASSYLSYSDTSGNYYSIDWNATANAAGLADVALTALPNSQIPITGLPAVATTYNGTLYVKNSLTTCQSLGTPISVTINPLPVITINPPSLSICPGTQGTLQAQGGIYYQWVPQNVYSQNLTVSAAGSYTVIGFDSQGCSAASAPATVSVYQAPATPTISGSNLACPGGGTVTLTATAGYSQYFWSTGATGQSINVPVGSYYAWAYDANGCRTANSATFTVTERYMAYPVIGVEPHCGYTVLTAFQNRGNYWSTGEWGSSITVYTPGTYWLENVSGSCVVGPTYASVNIYQPVTPSISKSSGNYCTNGVVLTASPAGMSYYWSTGESSQSITVFAPGNYSVQVTNGGCGPYTATTNVPTRSCGGPPCNKCRVASDGTTLEEDDKAAPEDAVFYPNPVDKELIIDLQRPVQIKTSIRLVDNMGKVVHQSYFESGESKRVVVTDQFAQGMYVLVVANDEHTLINSNVVVNRRQ